jgi:carbamoyl-phosphate synthase large subunit
LGNFTDSIDAAEDRERFEQILRQLDIRQPPNGIARSFQESQAVAKRIGYPW